MPIRAAEPFSAFLEGRKARQQEEYGNTRNALARMEAEQMPTEYANRNRMADMQAQQYSQEQVTRALQQTAAGAMRIAQSQNPQAEAAAAYPEFAAKLREQNPDWDRLSPEEARQYAGWIAGQAQSKLGIAPSNAQDEPFTLKPGEARYKGGTVVAERAATPEKEPSPSFQHVTLANGNIGAFDSRTGRISDTGQKAPPNAAGENRTFNRADKLRDEYNSASKEFVTVGDAYTRVTEAARDPSAAGDLSMIFAYMKMLDPNSVVREQEFANAQNAAGVPDRVRASWNKALRGERLAPAQRADFLKQADKLYKGQKGRHDTTVKKRYTEMSKRWGIDPNDVVGDLDIGFPPAQAAQPASQQPTASPTGEVRVNSPEEAMALPPGTVFITPDGRRKVR